MSWKGSKPTDFLKNIEKSGAEKLQGLASQAINDVVSLSPSIGGSFKGSHTVSVNSPDNSFKEHNDPSGSSTISKGQNAIKNAKFGDSVYIQTNHPLGSEIEHGNATKAPQGVYSIAMLNLKSKK